MDIQNILSELKAEFSRVSRCWEDCPAQIGMGQGRCGRRDCEHLLRVVAYLVA
jgi:hypothetical protein